LADRPSIRPVQRSKIHLSEAIQQIERWKMLTQLAQSFDARQCPRDLVSVLRKVIDANQADNVDFISDASSSVSFHKNFTSL
jgi:hypothetical protein